MKACPSTLKMVAQPAPSAFGLRSKMSPQEHS